MCATCGCSEGNKVTVTNPATGEQTILSHAEAHALGAAHDHSQGSNGHSHSLAQEGKSGWKWLDVIKQGFMHSHAHAHGDHHHDHNHAQAHEHLAALSVAAITATAHGVTVALEKRFSAKNNCLPNAIAAGSPGAASGAQHGQFAWLRQDDAVGTNRA